MSIVAQTIPYSRASSVLLVDEYPDLAKQWSPTNTKDVNTVFTGTSYKAIWICEKGHIWTAAVADRTKRGRGCPYCANKKVLPGFNDLATTHPELAKQWSNKNMLPPTQVTHGHNKKVWWIGECGHEWEASPEKRTRPKNPTGCSVCDGKSVQTGVNDLATLYPALAIQWSSKNHTNPQKVSGQTHTKYWWVCEKGHEWEASPHARVRANSGCPICSHRLNRNPVEILTELNPSIVSEYLGPVSGNFRIKAKSNWKCAVCGHKWAAMFDNRMYGSGCPKCANRFSKMEQDVADTVRLLGVSVVSPDRAAIKPLELDIHIPSHNLAIEFNGVYWHSEATGKDKDYHANKTRLCAEKGIRLLHIWEDEWLRNPELVQRMIARKLGKSAEVRVPARKTTIISLTKDEALPFLNEHHIQGFTSGTYYLGLRNGDELVAVMVLKRTKQELRLERYATSCIVQGGFGKLIAWIQRTLDFEKIITFADLCVSDGGLYENNGWTRDGELAPDYRYVVRSERVHKFNYRLKRFREDPDLLWEEGLTEKQLAELNGIPRIWDCGKIRYVLHKEKNDKTT